MPSTEVEIEEAGPEDLPDAAALHRKVWVATYAGIYPQSRFDIEDDAFFLDYWKEPFADTRPERLNLVARSGARVVGVVSVIPPDATGRAVIDRLYVDFDVQGDGIGSKFMTRIRRHLQSHGVKHMSAWIVDGNEGAQRFFTRHGFEHDENDHAARMEFKDDRAGVFMLRYDAGV